MVKKIFLLAFAASAAFSSAFAADECTVAISPSLGIFSGEQIKPTVKRVVCDDVELDVKSVSYGKNINAGANAGSVFVTVAGNTDPIEKKFDIEQKPIKITINDAEKEKGTKDPEFTWSLEEVKNVNVDTVANLKTALQSYIELTRKSGEEVYTYPITFADGIYEGLAKKFPNYDFSFTPGTLTITKTKVTVVATSCAKVYGESDPKKFEYTIHGNIEESDYTKLGEIVLSRPKGEDVVEKGYAISVSVENMETDDYYVETVPGTFVIQPAPVKVVVDDVEKVYGDATPEFSYKATGLLGKDELTGASFVCKKCVSSGLEPVGEFSVDVTFKDGSNPNYKVSVESGLLTVTPRAITVTVSDAEKTYGDADPKFSLDVKNLATEKEQLEGATITRAEGEDVGTYKVGVTFEKGSNSNYTMTVKSGTLTISPKAVTLAADKISKKFGEKDPTLTYTVDGIVSFDGVEDVLKDVTLTREKGEDAGTYAITASVVAKSNPNYEITTTDGVFTIVPNDDKIVVTVTGHVDTVEYDGKVQTVKGFDMASSSEAYSLKLVKYTGDSTVSGTKASKHMMGLSAEDFENTSGNYPNVTFKVTDGYLLVKPRALVVTATSDTITYGDATPTTFGWTADRLLEGDELEDIHVSLTKSSTGLLDAGKYELDFDVKASALDNYVVSEYVPGTLVVNKKLVTVTVADTSKVYAQPDPETFRFEVTGLLEGDELTGLVAAREAGENVRPDDPYRISVSIADDAVINPNYQLKVKQGYFTITPYTEPIKVIIIGNTITMKYTGEEITVEKSFDVIPFNDGSSENTLPAEYAYSKEYVSYTGTPTVSGTAKYLYPMNLDVSEFVNISPNFESVSFILSGDGTLIINESGPTSIAAVKKAPSFDISSMGRAIQVNGSKIGAHYAVVDLRGKVVRKGVVESANFEIQVPTAGVYMVRVGSSAKRVHVR